MIPYSWMDIGTFFWYVYLFPVILQSCSHEVNSQWLPLGKDTIECFELKDLWNCYEKWSALGAGTPMLLENRHTLMQYYVPYLSSIQIYTTKSVAATSR